jgi:hypothetical protein
MAGGSGTSPLPSRIASIISPVEEGGGGALGASGAATKSCV